jgi:RNAse (barnase) inhibitor barstar|tara:strand:- start:844 stop:1308 length:465 start_codon:yes stop_codon:yes gene_type:complete
MSQAVNRQIQRLLKSGGSFEPAELRVALEPVAIEAGVQWGVADCSRARNRSAVFRAVVKAVDYPEFIPGKFEALYDCLCDTLLDQKVGLVLIFNAFHSADEGLEKDMEGIMQVLNDTIDFAQENGRVFIYGIENAGRHPDADPGVVHNWSDAHD